MKLLLSKLSFNTTSEVVLANIELRCAHEREQMAVDRIIRNLIRHTQAVLMYTDAGVLSQNK